MFGASHSGSNSTNAFHCPGEIGKMSEMWGHGFHIHNAVRYSGILRICLRSSTYTT